jgi:hypothetical protein
VSKHIIVRNDERVLSRVTPHGPLEWLDIDVTRCTDYRYAITFDRHGAALKCAGMHGAEVHRIGEWDSEAA